MVAKVARKIWRGGVYSTFLGLGLGSSHLQVAGFGCHSIFLVLGSSHTQVPGFGFFHTYWATFCPSGNIFSANEKTATLPEVTINIRRGITRVRYTRSITVGVKFMNDEPYPEHNWSTTLKKNLLFQTCTILWRISNAKNVFWAGIFRSHF